MYGDVWIGGDSLVASGWTKNKLAYPKVIRKAPFVLGFAGSVRVGNIITHSFNPEKSPPKSVKALRKYMCTYFVDSLREALEEAGAKKINNNVEGTDNGWLMIGINGRIFQVATDFSVCEMATPYDAIGCGEDFALGAMAAAYKLKTDPKEIATLGLESASKHSAFVEGPFTILKL